MNGSRRVLKSILIVLAFLAVAALVVLVPYIPDLKARLFWSQLLSKIFLFVLVFDGLLFLVLVVLQDSKSGGLAGMLGGATVETVMGPQSSKYLNKLTTLLAGILFISLFALGILNLSFTQQALLTGDMDSQETAAEEATAVPATPATPESDQVPADDPAMSPAEQPSEEPQESTNP